MASPWLNTLFIMHFDILEGMVVYVKETDWIITFSGFSALVVKTHTPKDYPEPVFIYDCWMIAPWDFWLDLFDPSVGCKRIDMDSRERIATMTSYQDSFILIIN